MVEQKRCYFLSPFALEKYLISRDGFGRPVPRHPHSQHYYTINSLNLELTHRLLSFLSLSATAPIYTGNRHRVNLEFIRPLKSVPMAFTVRVRRHRGPVLHTTIYSGSPIDQPMCACPFPPPTLEQCVCVFSSHSFWTSSSLDVPAGVTQEEGHTGFLTHLLSAVRALIFLARRIQPFLSLVDREVELCVLTIF